MHDEITAVVTFLTSNLSPLSLPPSHPSLTAFSHSLSHILHSHYHSHWHTTDPQLGSAYRSLLRFSDKPDDLDPLILDAARHANLPQLPFSNALRTSLGPKWEIWVDPGCVSYRLAVTNETKEIWGKLPEYVRRRINISQPVAFSLPGTTSVTGTPVKAKAGEDGETETTVADAYALAASALRAQSTSPTKRSRAVKIVRPTLPGQPSSSQSSTPEPISTLAAPLSLDSQSSSFRRSPFIPFTAAPVQVPIESSSADLNLDFDPATVALTGAAADVDAELAAETTLTNISPDAEFEGDVTVRHTLLPAAPLRQDDEDDFFTVGGPTLTCGSESGSISPTSDVFRPSSRSSVLSDNSVSSSYYTSDSAMSGTTTGMGMGMGRSDIRDRGHSPASSIGSSLMMMSKSSLAGSPVGRNANANANANTNANANGDREGRRPSLSPFVFPPSKAVAPTALGADADDEDALTIPSRSLSLSPSKRRGNRPHGHTPALSTSSTTSSASISSTRSRPGVVTEHSNGKVGVLGGGVLLGVRSPAPTPTGSISLSSSASGLASMSASAAASVASSTPSTPGGGVGASASPRKRGDRRRRTDSSASMGMSGTGMWSGASSMSGSMFGHGHQHSHSHSHSHSMSHSGHHAHGHGHGHVKQPSYGVLAASQNLLFAQGHGQQTQGQGMYGQYGYGPY